MVSPVTPFQMSFFFQYEYQLLFQGEQGLQVVGFLRRGLSRSCIFFIDCNADNNYRHHRPRHSQKDNQKVFRHMYRIKTVVGLFVCMLVG